MKRELKKLVAEDGGGVYLPDKGVGVLVPVDKYHTELMKRVTGYNKGEITKICSVVVAAWIEKVAGIAGKSGTDSEEVWNKLRYYWIGLGLYGGDSEPDYEALDKVLEEYRIEDIVAAMDLYARILRRKDLFISLEEMALDEFIVRGVREFHPDTNAEERYKRVRMIKPRATRKVSVRNMNKILWYIENDIIRNVLSKSL